MTSTSGGCVKRVALVRNSKGKRSMRGGLKEMSNAKGGWIGGSKRFMGMISTVIM